MDRASLKKRNEEIRERHLKGFTYKQLCRLYGLQWCAIQRICSPVRPKNPMLADHAAREKRDNEIRELRQSGARLVELAKQYSMSRENVCRIAGRLDPWTPPADILRQ
jgi:Mor family transcriptional regulator